MGIIYNFESYDDSIYFNLKVDHTMRNYFNNEVVKDTIQHGLNNFIYLSNSQKNFKSKSDYRLFLDIFKEDNNKLSAYYKQKIEDIIEESQIPLEEYSDRDTLSTYITRSLIKNISKDFQSIQTTIFEKCS